MKRFWKQRQKPLRDGTINVRMGQPISAEEARINSIANQKKQQREIEKDFLDYGLAIAYGIIQRRIDRGEYSACISFSFDSDLFQVPGYDVITSWDTIYPLLIRELENAGYKIRGDRMRMRLWIDW